MRATGACSGITSGEPAAAHTRAIEALRYGINYLFFETPDDYLVSLDSKDRQRTLAH
jgi:hypothetical protein